MFIHLFQTLCRKVSTNLVLWGSRMFSCGIWWVLGGDLGQVRGWSSCLCNMGRLGCSCRGKHLQARRFQSEFNLLGHPSKLSQHEFSWKWPQSPRDGSLLGRGWRGSVPWSLAGAAWGVRSGSMAVGGAGAPWEYSEIWCSFHTSLSSRSLEEAERVETDVNDLEKHQSQWIPEKETKLLFRIG